MVAELGRAKHVKVEDLQPGMKVHRDVLGRGEKVLINAGEILSRKHCTQMKKWERQAKPTGSALPKKNPKDVHERVQHAEFQGGWRPSDFNPNGVLVSSTLASGDESPAVDRDPMQSPVIQSLPRKSYNVPVDGVESPVNRQLELSAEIRALESVNAQLGGDLHAQALEFETGHYEETLIKRREALKASNAGLVAALKAAKNGNGHKTNEPATPRRSGKAKSA